MILSSTRVITRAGSGQGATVWGDETKTETDDAVAEAGPGPDQRSDHAFTALLHETAGEIDRQLAVFLGSEAESGPHKTRVALRRLTTALQAFAPILKRQAAAKARAEAKRIFRSLGEVRDADVYLAGRRGSGDGAGPDSDLARETAELRLRVRERLRMDKAVAFAPALLRDLAEGLILKTGKPGLAARARPVAALAGKALDAAWEAGLAHGPNLAKLDEEARHEFRKDMKTLRYTAEFFEPFWPEEVWGGFHAALQELQDSLGLLNDLAVARQKSGIRGKGGKTKRTKAELSKEEALALEDACTLWRRLQAAGPFWRAVK
ncbi:CHAD domain-containing protein [Neotabrizicola sp. sgz301269]|uniref:CHAD domain-containing protein n=1 Tax=Neotabrizicola sp. sgz301269 TaxID=3276282 RepID=UPI00377014FC